MKINKNFGISERIEELVENLNELGGHQQKRKSKIKLEVDYVTPLSILPLVIYANSNDIAIEPHSTDYDVASYLETIGFPQGIENFHGEKKRYLPIMKIPCLCESKTLTEYESRILLLIDEECRGSFTNALNYLTFELEANVREHAHVDHYWLLAQYWNMNKICEIMIADTGIGYKDSYKGTSFEVDSDLAAIRNALQGKSSKDPIERGAGIPHIVNMFTKGYGGKVVIMSGDSLVYYGKDTAKNYKMSVPWQGALIGINFVLKNVPVEKYY